MCVGDLLPGLDRDQIHSSDDFYFYFAVTTTAATTTTGVATTAYCDATWTQKNWIGDGYCDDVTNTEGCQWDGGDCCGDNVNTQYCDFTTYKCACLDPGAGGSGTTTITTGPTNSTTTGSKHW